MTSIHMNSSESQAGTQTLNGSLNQSQTVPSKYDEAERVRQRMEELRRHHAESADIHNRTQPAIDGEIHTETIKYLKSNQVNVTKTKSQKPRAPKRQRTAANANATINSTTTPNSSASSTPSIQLGVTNNHNQLITGRPPVSVNHSQHSVHRQQQIPPIQHQQPQLIHQQGHAQPQIIMQTGAQPIQQISAPYQPALMQQPPMHMQHQQRSHQNQVSHQTYNGAYHPHQYQSPPLNYQQQQQQRQQQQKPQHQAPQQHNIQATNHNQHMPASTDQAAHYDSGHQGYAQQNHHAYYQPQPVVSSHQQNHVTMSHQNHLHHNSYPTLPNDLDLNLQAGLECDIDSLIKHEMSVEGQLDFNNDLLLKLDNHYQPNHL